MSKPLSIDEALDYIKERRIILCYDHRLGVTSWSPGQPLPMKLNRTIYRERARLRAALRSGDWRLCHIASHRRSWRYAGDGRYQCEMCIKLDRVIGDKSA